ncbi:hypothetical protein AAF712_000702 [Marasmius tenuissimus]|uniref:RRM domain-containing protein n=1 Tax=Marasmius tenuissimus TaxID=585030 RepID=A0ABR3AE11_9AGAR
MAAATKLTKKQKKALAFRERKSGKGGKDATSNDMEGNELPEMDVQDIVDEQGDQVEDGKLDEKKKKRFRGKSKKRKRENEGDVETKVTTEDAKASKRRKTEGDKERLILFLGNLKYTTSQESITSHFNACDPPPTIRLLTPKTASEKSTKSKGCAFLEFETKAALQQALKLHHSKLDGRTINVELTAGGGGNSETRLKKLRERNKKLHGQRKPGKDGKSDKGENAAGNTTDQRYSATSGVGEAPATKNTWTVGDTVEEGPRSRGGKKHSKRGARKPAKEWGTGVNAIPVG